MVAAAILGLITPLAKNALIVVDWAKYGAIRVVEVVVAMDSRIQPQGVPVVLVMVIRQHPIQQLILAAHVADPAQDLSQKPVILVVEIKYLLIPIIPIL